MPPGVSPEICRKIITLMKRCQTKVVLDVDGEALRQGIKALPDVIKPDIHELSELAGRELKDMDEILAAAREHKPAGCGDRSCFHGGKEASCWSQKGRNTWQYRLQ